MKHIGELFKSRCLGSTSGSGGPPCPHDLFKIMQFSGNWANFGLRDPLGVKICWPPLTKILDLPMARKSNVVSGWQEEGARHQNPTNLWCCKRAWEEIFWGKISNLDLWFLFLDPDLGWLFFHSCRTWIALAGPYKTYLLLALASRIFFYTDHYWLVSHTRTRHLDTDLVSLFCCDASGWLLLYSPCLKKYIYGVPFQNRAQDQVCKWIIWSSTLCPRSAPRTRDGYFAAVGSGWFYLNSPWLQKKKKTFQNRAQGQVCKLLLKSIPVS